MDLYIK